MQLCAAWQAHGKPDIFADSGKTQGFPLSIADSALGAMRPFSRGIEQKVAPAGW
jgi:hypothetical protein